MSGDAHTNEFDRNPSPATATHSISIPSFQIPPTGDIVNIDNGIKNLDVETSQENTRARIAWLFTQAFLVLVVLSFMTPFVVALLNPSLIDNPLESAKSLLTVLTSVLGGPFGFIVGFYFKQSISNNNV